MVEETVAALRSVCDILLPKPEQMTRLNFPAAMAAAGISPPNSTGSPPPPGGNNGSEIKLQSMLREDEALDYVSSYVGAAKVIIYHPNIEPFPTLSPNPNSNSYRCWPISKCRMAYIPALLTF
eukprot:1362922-Amorphochlora_amoeboformis.AAC.2